VPFGDRDKTITTSYVEDNGAFCLEVDYPAGPIVLEFVGRSAQLQRLVKTQNIALGNHKLTLFLHHEPGASIDGLTPDGLTSIATALCLGLYDELTDAAPRSNKDIEALCDDVHRTLNLYALADQADGSDIRSCPMAPSNSHAQSAPRDAQYKLLWHAAADYLAESMGVSWLDLVMHGVADARADAFLDGKGATGTPIAVRQRTLDGMTFRSDLARAGLRLTRAVPLGELKVDPPPGLTEDGFVDYWEHLARFDSLYFDPRYGGELDTHAPRLAPQPVPEGLTGDVRVCVQIEDDSEVVASGFETDRDGLELEDVTLDDGRLCGTLRTGSQDDGPIAITYWVVDSNGARGEGSFAGIRIANQKPDILDLASPCILRNEPTHIEICARHEHLEGMRVKRPLVASESFEKRPAEAKGCLTIAMAPETYHEGLLGLEVEALARHVSGSRVFECLVDNHDPGSLQLCAFADTALAEAEVQACWLQPDGSCEPLDPVPELVTDRSGCTTVPLPDDRAGELHVRTRGGWYWSAVHRDDQDDPVRIYAPSELGVTATFPYSPRRPATTLTDRTASYVTTWADAWAVAHLSEETTREQMVEVLQEGYSRFGLHFGRDLHATGMDVRATTPRDLIDKTRHSSATSEPSTRLGVVQAAIARCAADWSIDHGSAPEALPSLTLAAEVIVRDPSDLHFDGINARGARISVMGNDLDQNTLRHALATCGALWLDSASNRTTLRARNFSQADGFFPLVSANQDRQLFGTLASDFLVFDRTAPELTAVLVDQDLAPLPLRPVPVDRALMLRIDATDDGGFAAADGLIRPEVSITPGPPEALGDPILHSASSHKVGVTYAIVLAHRLVLKWR
jgi:hypothetical protein